MMERAAPIPGVLGEHPDRGVQARRNGRKEAGAGALTRLWRPIRSPRQSICPPHLRGDVVASLQSPIAEAQIGNLGSNPGKRHVTLEQQREAGAWSASKLNSYCRAAEY